MNNGALSRILINVVGIIKYYNEFIVAQWHNVGMAFVGSIPGSRNWNGICYVLYPSYSIKNKCGVELRHVTNCTAFANSVECKCLN